MKRILLTVLALGSLIFANAQSEYYDKTAAHKYNLRPIYTAVPSLQIAPDARAGGMGDIGASSAPDLNSQYWNPAKFPQMQSNGGIAFSYTPWLKNLVSDINLFYLTGFWQFAPKQALSASLKYFSLGEVQFRNNDSDPGVNVKPNEFSVDLAYSRLLSECWSAAVALRYIRSDLGGGVSNELYAGNAVAADIAVYYLQPLRCGAGSDLALGIDISNIGSKISFDDGNTKDFLPTNFRLGLAFGYKFDDYNKLTIMGETNKLLVPCQYEKDGTLMDDKKYSDISPISGIFKSFSDAPDGFKEELKEFMWSLGLEYSYQDQFFARCGYFHESQDKGNRKYFTFGAGFKLNIFELQAAYVIAQGNNNPLDKTLRFTLGFDMAGLKTLVSNKRAQN
ncbi:MAG: type IX secretion system outer membrane channel protein PorV [Paludibacteraceae bacterium]|nr:type IX secretion system outer membrane channel protein PorV [Paludibacteraceae bacterium]